MDFRLLGLLLLIPLLDVMVLVVLATYIGVAATVALVVLTALVGLLLVRAEGRHTVRKLQRKVARGELPTDELLDGALLLVAGALLLTPGIVTDFIGFVLVLPPTRYPVRVVIKRYVVRPYLEERAGGFPTGNVYVGGFPGNAEGTTQASGPGTAGGSAPPGGSPGDTVEVDEDDYTFEDSENTDNDDSANDRIRD